MDARRHHRIARFGRSALRSEHRQRGYGQMRHRTLRPLAFRESFSLQKKSSMSIRGRSTPAGEHRAVLLDEVLAALKPQPGETVVDCTVGWAGHAAELLRRVGPKGRVIGIDFDAENLLQ